MKDKLTFDNLRELLDKFSVMNDVSKKYACTIDARISYGTR